METWQLLHLQTEKTTHKYNYYYLHISNMHQTLRAICDNNRRKWCSGCGHSLGKIAGLA